MDETQDKRREMFATLHKKREAFLDYNRALDELCEAHNAYKEANTTSKAAHKAAEALGEALENGELEKTGITSSGTRFSPQFEAACDNADVEFARSRVLRRRREAAVQALIAAHAALAEAEKEPLHPEAFAYLVEMMEADLGRPN